MISKIEWDRTFDLGLNALDEVGEPVDDRFQQADQDVAAAGEVGLGPIAARRIDGEGARLGITQRDQPLPLRMKVTGVVLGSPLLGLMETSWRS